MIEYDLVSKTGLLKKHFAVARQKRSKKKKTYLETKPKFNLTPKHNH